ncbi:MAG: leucine-rich repeat domain-containing protein [Verrucomicrobiota bacterium]
MVGFKVMRNGEIITRALLYAILWAGLITAARASTFSFVDHGATIEITGFAGAEVEHLEIPAEISGKPVTQIAANAFDGTDIRSVVLAAGIEEIGSRAFFGCIRLRTFSISDGLRIIGSEAFGQCFGLRLLTLPESVESIGADAFNVSGLSSVYFLGDLPSIGGDLAELQPRVYFFADYPAFQTVSWKENGSLDLGPKTDAIVWMFDNDLFNEFWTIYDPDNSELNVSDMAAVPRFVPQSLQSLFYYYAMDLPFDNEVVESMDLSGVQPKYRFYAGRADVDYIVEVSSNLVTWIELDEMFIVDDVDGYRFACLNAGVDIYIRVLATPK